MKRFTFPLEPLRVLRQQKERVAQQRYARALDACNQAEAQLNAAVAELAAGWSTFARDLAGGVTAGRLANARTWCTVLEIRRHECRAAVAEARRAAEQVFQEMLVATREREGLDRFYDKARSAYEHEVLVEEQKNFDELAVQLNGNGAPGLFQFAGHEHTDWP
jgi:flagellar export protein FliJ